MDEPTVAFFAITLTALVYTAFSIHITGVIGNRKRVKEIQEEMNRISAKLREIDYNTEAGRKEAEEEQRKIPALMNESMMLQFKPLLITLPLFLIMSYIVRTLFPNFVIKLAFALPIFIQNLDRFPNWRDEFGPLGWFILCLLFSSILMQVIIDRTKGRKNAAKV